MTLISRRRVLAASAALPALALGNELQIYGVGIIGHTGRGNFGHGLDTMWKNLPRTTIVAVADADAGGLAKAREKLELSEAGAFSDYREMLAEAQPDIVAICPRHVDQHRDMAVAAAEAGAKGIYLEKPFCRDLAEADEIVAACETNGTKLAVAHRNRYHPALPVALRIMQEGEIGTPIELRLRGKEDQRGGILDLWVLGSHLFNLALVFAGRPIACSANVYRDGIPVGPKDVVEGDEGVGPLAGNEVHARFEMESGLPVFFDSKKDAGTREAGFGIQIVGTGGVLDLRIDREPLVHLRQGNPFLPDDEPRAWIPVTSAGVGSPEPVEGIASFVAGHIAAGDDLIDAIEKDRPPLSSAEDARTVVAMTMAVLESHRQGGKRIAFPLERKTNPFADW